MIGIYYICTGPYNCMFDQFINSLSNFAKEKNKEVILLTDSKEQLYNLNIDHIKVTLYYILDMPWPLVTLLKMNYIYDFKKDYFTHIYYFNADMIILKDIFKENIDILLLHHKCHTENQLVIASNLGDSVNNKFSTSYIKNNTQYKYIMGGFFGGRANVIYDMCKNVKEWVQQDLYMCIIPRWHDETYLNKWVIDNKYKYSMDILEDYLYRPREQLALFLHKPKKFIPKKDNNIQWKYKYSEIYNIK